MKMWQTMIKEESDAMPSLYEILHGLYQFYCIKIEERMQDLPTE